MKKALSLLLTVLIALTSFSSVQLSALAAEYVPEYEYVTGVCGVGVTYSLNKTSGVLTISGVGKMFDFTEDGSPFYDNSDVKTVYIWEGVYSIGNNAFSSCDELENVYFPNSVYSIGSHSFADCKKLQQFKIDVFSALRTIKEGAFERSGLVSIELPDSLNTIESRAFADCADLVSIDFSPYISVIGDDICKGSDNTVNSVDTDSVTDKNLRRTNQRAQLTHDKIDDRTYNGKEQRPTVVLRYNDKKLTEGTDYVVSYSSNVDAGRALIGIAFKNSYKRLPNKTISFTINSADAKKLSVKITAAVYDGNNKTPSVKVTDANGKTVGTSNYSVDYPSSKNVGTYKITLKFKENYKGDREASFVINPKKTDLSKLTAKKKAIAVKWKKQTSQTSGYQLQYDTSSKFTKAKSVTVKKNSDTGTTIKKLKGGKKYYVRIRTFKTVDGKKYYSAWSTSKSVKTKK